MAYLSSLTGRKIKDSYPDIEQAFVEVEADMGARLQTANYSGGFKNKIINGNFDIWQRGTSFTNPAGLQYITDRWRISSNDISSPPTVIESRQALTAGELDKSYYFYRINVNGAGSGYGANALHGIKQPIENGVRYYSGLNKKVTLSFYARSDISGKKLGAYIDLIYGTGGSPTATEIVNGNNWTLTSNWTKYTHTFTLNTLSGKTFGSNNDDNLGVVLQAVWGSGTADRFGAVSAETFVGAGNIDIAQVQLEEGDVATPFEQKLFVTELELCQRYYEKSFPLATAPAQGAGVQGAVVLSVAVNATVANNKLQLMFRAPKRNLTYTLTFYNPVSANTNWYNSSLSADSGASAETGSSRSEQGVSLNCTQTVNDLIGHALRVHYTIDNEL